MRQQNTAQNIQHNQLAESLLLACQDKSNVDTEMFDYVSQHLYIQSSMRMHDSRLTTSQRKYYTAFFQSCSKLINAENDNIKQQAIDEIKHFIG